MQLTLLDRMDRETRTLALLALAALVFVIAAAFALASSSRVVEPAFEPEPFFPGLAQKLGGVREVVVATKDASLRIARDAEGRWVLPQKDNYPVRREPLREILLGLSDLTKVQPATANPEWHKELRLGAPDKGGEATRVSLKGEDGAELVTLLVGEQADLPDISGLDSWYVRLPGDMQSWLARGTLSPRLDPAAWIVTDVVPVDAGRIRSATITPPEGPSYTVARDDEKAKGFTLKTLPEGAEPRGPRVADSVGQAIADLKILDARLASDFNFENAPVARYRTFDGLEITVRSLKLGEDIWAAIEARYDGQPGGDAAQSFDASSLAANINRRVAGWAFLLPSHAGGRMRQPLSQLLKQPEAATAAVQGAADTPTTDGADAPDATAAPDGEGKESAPRGAGPDEAEKAEPPEPSRPDAGDGEKKEAPAEDAGTGTENPDERKGEAETDNEESEG